MTRDAYGSWRRARALSGVVDGHDFRVVWICREPEWTAAALEGRSPEGIPWPAEDVTTPRP